MLSLNHISKCFGSHQVLHDISFDVNAGEVISILGPSGCGKSTLLNIILGLVPIDSGKIIFNGEDVTKLAMNKRGFNIVFQDYALFPHLNAIENIQYGVKNLKQKLSQSYVNELIELLGLQEHLYKNINLLSGGQKQRVALARTLVMQPKVLLLDEPLSALDGMLKESIKERIKNIARTLKLSILIVTHDPEEAMTLSDRIMILNNGSILQYGTPQEIIHQPAHQFINEFILNQLHIKRTNIFKLFEERYACQAI